jgi:hypothetical protein
MASSNPIQFHQKGDFERLSSWLEKLKNKLHISILDKYGRKGVEALRLATPVDSGVTAASWRYEIQNERSGATLTFHNDNVNKHVNIAIILQYGHGTGTGGWVEGRDYLNPVIQPLFDELAKEAWKEITDV